MAMKVKDNMPSFKKSLDALLKTRVLVGIPAEKAGRQPEKGKTKAPLNNAEIGYLMETGIPEQNVPARPFLVPGVQKVETQIAATLKTAGQKALDGNPAAVVTAFTKVGMTAVRSVQQTMKDGPYPPLSPKTVANRFRDRKTKRRRKGEKDFLGLVSEGATSAEAQEQTGIQPLLNTLQLLKSITFVVRPNGKR